MKADRSLILKTLLPLVIGVAVVAWLFGREFSLADLERIPWSGRAVWALSLALLAVAGREFGLAWRFRILTDGRLSAMAALRVTMMCEFTSTITPTTAGGSAMSVWFMHREGVSGGRASSVMLVTLLLDEGFMAVVCPLALILLGPEAIFGFSGSGGSAVDTGIRAAFWAVWGVTVAWTLVLFTAIILRPSAMSALLRKLFASKWLRRWQKTMDGVADDLLETSRQMRGMGWRWWAKAAGATALSWLSRFLVVNALFAAFIPDAPQALVLGRQAIVWLLLTVSPTPGGSGISEWLFTTYYGDLVGDRSMTLVVAVMWRILTYYIYLAAGAVVIPAWSRKRHLQ